MKKTNCFFAIPLTQCVKFVTVHAAYSERGSSINDKLIVKAISKALQHGEQSFS